MEKKSMVDLYLLSLLYVWCFCTEKEQFFG